VLSETRRQQLQAIADDRYSTDQEREAAHQELAADTPPSLPTHDELDALVLVFCF
jgi:hypothetical protein